MTRSVASPVDRASASAGFALIELLVALAIASAIAALALPKVNDMRSAAALERAVGSLTSLLKADRNAALADGRTVYTAIDLRSGQVTSGARNEVLRFPQGTRLVLERTDNAASGNTSGFLFFGDGRSSGGRLLLSDGRRRHDIAVNWATAAIVASARASSEGIE